MSSADRRNVLYCLNTWPGRYGFALATVAVAALVRYGLDVALGFTYPFSLFYPAIMLVALLGGAGPGVLATLCSAVLAAYLFLEPLNSFTVRHPRDIVGLTLFGIMGIAISGMCDLFRRRGKRLEEFEKVVEDLEEMIVVVDRDYRYVIANRAFLKYRRTIKEDLIGRRIPDLLSHPEVFETTLKGKLDECFRGNVVRFEMRNEYPEVGERDLFVSYFPIEGRGGVDRVACVLQDVTERKRADHATEESEKRFRAVYEGSPIGISLVDPESGRFLEVNPKFCEILGRSEAEVLKLDYPSVTHPDDVEGSLSRRRKLREGETTSFEMEKRYVRSDGEEVWANVSVAPMWRGEKPEKVFLVMAQDITQRKRAEAELSEREDRYRDLIEHSQDLVCTHDLEGNLLSMNPEPAHILGYEVGELLKRPMRDLIAPECVKQFDAYMERMKSTGADEGLLPVMTRNGERRIWEYRNTLRTDGVISPIVRGMARDFTERKRAEQNLQDAKEFSEKLIQTANVMILGLDTDGNVNLLNGAGEEITGYTSRS